MKRYSYTTAEIPYIDKDIKMNEYGNQGFRIIKIKECKEHIELTLEKEIE